VQLDLKFLQANKNTHLNNLITQRSYSFKLLKKTIKDFKNLMKTPLREKEERKFGDEDFTEIQI